MMLFWAGLRGAVGVALAAGITGDNADALRTTILVVVVLTVIVFGGTTARMLEVLGIRVGVEDEDASSDEEDGWTRHHGNLGLQMGPGSRRYAREAFQEDNLSENGSPYLHPGGASGSRRALRPAFTQQARSGFSTNSDDSEDGEPLPSATYGTSEYDAAEEGIPTKPGMIFRDGQWFTALDERYLLPLFSNSVTARRHHAKRAKKASVYNGDSADGTPRVGNSMDLSRDADYAADGESENGKNKLPRTFR